MADEATLDECPALSAEVYASDLMVGRAARDRSLLLGSIQPIMKLTLNSAVPLRHRHTVEQMVAKVAPGAEICWLPSRFPRLVMLVQPDVAVSGRITGNSIFDDGDDRGVGDFSAELENSIQQLLNGAT